MTYIQDLCKQYHVKSCYRKGETVQARFGTMFTQNDCLWLHFHDYASKNPRTDCRRVFCLRLLKRAGLIAYSLEGEYAFSAMLKPSATKCGLRIIGALPIGPNDHRADHNGKPLSPVVTAENYEQPADPVRKVFKVWA